MDFFKKHAALRIILILAFFLLGLGLVLYGWTLVGKMAGVGIMLAGIVSLLLSMKIYNIRYE